MRDLIKLLVIIILLIFFSCKKEIDESEIRSRFYRLQNIGWKSKSYTNIIDNISYTATEVPLQYYLLKDKGNFDLVEVDRIFEENKTERIIEFTFEDENQDDLLQEKYTNLDYKKSVEYMSFAIQKNFFVVTSKKDTIQCSGVLFERNFKVAPFNKLMLFFSKIDPNDKIQLVYKDKLFQKGTLKFRFKDPILKL